jgi:hypothetical protein
LITHIVLINFPYFSSFGHTARQPQIAIGDKQQEKEMLALNPVPQEQAKTLFNKTTGAISSEFKKQLELVNIVIEKGAFPDLDPYHLLNVDAVLQKNGCFQRDWDLYKKGGSSAFKIDFNQAKAFLDYDYSLYSTIMPRQKKLASAIFQCGVEGTMRKRFRSLQESLNQGYTYDSVHFITKDAPAKEEVEKLISEKYKETLQGMKTFFAVANSEIDIFEKGLKLLEPSSSLGKVYVIITDPTFAGKVEGITTRILQNRTCLGIASVPVNNWKEDIDGYGYEKALGSFEKATIALASSAWNFKARQVHAEMEAYKVTALSGK